MHTIHHLILLLLSLLLGSTIATKAQLTTSDSLPPSPNPLASIIPGAIYAAYPLEHLDESMRSSRHNLLGTDWKNDYDDYLQYASYGLQLAMHFGGVKGRSRNWIEMLTADAVGALGIAAATRYIKDETHRMRPDGSSSNSFPSGHTATAFLGAELFNLEYGADYPLLALSQYALASTVALGRIANNRHWYSDLLWGGVVGISMARIGYLCSDLIFGRYTLETLYQKPPASYLYLAFLQSYDLSGGMGYAGVQLGWQTPSLGYAAELSINPDKTRPALHSNLIVMAPLYHWQYLHLRQSYAIGIGYNNSYKERSYTHLRAGIELAPSVRYLDNLALSLHLHCEPYRRNYLTLGIEIRHRWAFD